MVTPSRTLEGLRALGPNGRRSIINALGQVADDILEEYQINTPLRIAHFWAQASHECAGFKTMHEYWGPTPAQRRYEGRKDLGNTQSGDGKRYMGRGIFQLTGRANYREYGRRLGLDLEGKPELAADPVNALRIACEYWKAKGLNRFADANDITTITRRINGGLNGFADRKANYVIAWRIWGGAGERPRSGRRMIESREGNGALAAGAMSGLGIMAEASSHAREASDNLVFPLWPLLLVILAICAAIWIWRRQRMRDMEE